MSDAVLFSLIGVAAALMIALALVWPQGLGTRSPAPFGHPPVEQAAAAKAARERANTPPPVLSMTPDLSSGPSR
jgi:hypothetical protein